MIVGASIARPLVQERTAVRTANGRPYEISVKEMEKGKRLALYAVLMTWGVL